MAVVVWFLLFSFFSEKKLFSTHNLHTKKGVHDLGPKKVFVTYFHMRRHKKTGAHNLWQKVCDLCFFPHLTFGFLITCPDICLPQILRARKQAWDLKLQRLQSKVRGPSPWMRCTLHQRATCSLCEPNGCHGAR